ncbi:MAG: metallophosphoesterase family protein [Gammaproteobacteria bacterium]|jgi:putative phosphoesterase|nr:metallophosphoesterase family protein [Gammaproteobacteria bacterium]
MASHRSLTVGLISDTHGLLRPEAVEALRGSDFIVHAGDIGDRDILAALSDLAPLTAIRGNNDTEAWARRLPETEVLTAGAVSIYVIHNLADIDLDPAAAGFRVVISGHSHRPGWRNKGGVLYVNPGSAGPRRFSLPVAVGQLVITGGRIAPKLFELQIDSGG